MKTFNQISQSAGYKEDDISVSITCCGGSYGGGSEVLVVSYGFIPKNSGRTRGIGYEYERSPTIDTGGGAY